MYDPVMNGGISIEFTLNKLHFSTSFLMVVGFFFNFSNRFRTFCNAAKQYQSPEGLWGIVFW